MYGVLAAQQWGIGGQDLSWLPDGAIAHLDFVDGHYYAGGAIRSVSELLGGGFDAGEIDANGMACWYTNTNRPIAVGPLLADIQATLPAGMTVVTELGSPTEEPQPSPFLQFFDDADPDSAVWSLYVTHQPFGSPSTQWLSDYDALGLNGAIAERTATGTNRFGSTLGRDVGGGDFRYAQSANGSTPLTQDLAYSAADQFATAGIVKVCIGAVDEWAYAFDYSYIRSITIYAAVDETALAALTA